MATETSMLKILIIDLIEWQSFPQDLSYMSYCPHEEQRNLEAGLENSLFIHSLSLFVCFKLATNDYFHSLLIYFFLFDILFISFDI